MSLYVLFFNNCEPIFIISTAFMNLNFQVLNFALLILVLGSFHHVFRPLEIHLVYVMLS